MEREWLKAMRAGAANDYQLMLQQRLELLEFTVREEVHRRGGNSPSHHRLAGDR